jgi:hypothetical protein
MRRRETADHRVAVPAEGIFEDLASFLSNATPHLAGSLRSADFQRSMQVRQPIIRTVADNGHFHRTITNQMGEQKKRQGDRAAFDNLRTLPSSLDACCSGFSRSTPGNAKAEIPVACQIIKLEAIHLHEKFTW